MKIKNHIQFLKDVLIYTLTAFGGPQAHFGMINKTFVEKKKYITHTELLDFYSFCQLLPGASSTQLLGCIGYKRGGVILSILSLIIWITPACILMSLFCLFLVNYTDTITLSDVFVFIKPMTLGFLLFSAWSASTITLHNTITKIIFIISFFLSIFYFKTPWIFPLIILLSGVITNLSNKRITQIQKRPLQNKLNWIPLFLFFTLFITAGILSENARKEDWANRKMYNVFENFYRFGSIVFGGGDVLFPMMLDQYVARPTDKKTIEKNPKIIKIDKEELLIGFGMVRSIPGPVFSVGSYVGGLALKQETREKQFLGTIIGTIGLFLPGVLLMLFFFPLFQQLKNDVIINRAMEGIRATIVSFMFGAAFFLCSDYVFLTPKELFLDLSVVILTFLALKFTKLPSPIIVLTFLVLGILYR